MYYVLPPLEVLSCASEHAHDHDHDQLYCVSVHAAAHQANRRDVAFLSNSKEIYLLVGRSRNFLEQATWVCSHNIARLTR